jgi:hypothetical protein
MLNVPMTAVLTTTRANAGEPISSDSGTKKIAGSSPVGYPLTQVGTQRTSVFCERCEKASPSTWVNRGPKEASAAIVSS